MRYAHVSGDAIAYVRETRDEAVLCLAMRAASEPIRVPLRALGARELETLAGEDAAVDGGDAVLLSEGPAFHAWRVV
jgi:alpha-glucosidase